MEDSFPSKCVSKSWARKGDALERALHVPQSTRTPGTKRALNRCFQLQTSLLRLLVWYRLDELSETLMRWVGTYKCWATSAMKPLISKSPAEEFRTAQICRSSQGRVFNEGFLILSLRCSDASGFVVIRRITCA